MNSIMIISRTNMATNQNYHSQTLVAKCMKLKILKLKLTILVKIYKCLVSVIAVVNRSITMIQTFKLLVNER